MMPIKIIPATEPIVINTIIFTIYGEPGIGKTSLANSADRPLTLDFDIGAHRAGNRKDVVAIREWEEVDSLTQDDVAGYRSIIIDTGGRMLDLIGASIINEPKASYKGALSQQGFGRMASIAKQFLSRLRGYGVDVIVVCHNKEDAKGDTTINRPEMQGSSKSEVLKFSDQVGFFHSVENKRTIDFQPSDSWVGKDSAGLGRVLVPHLAVEPQFMADLIGRAKRAINEAGATSSRHARDLDEWHNLVETTDDAGALTEYIELTGRLDVSIQRPAKAILMRRAKELELVFDTEKKVFVGQKVVTPAETSTSTSEQPGTTA